MDKATLESPTSGVDMPESSSSVVARNADPMTLAFRAATPLSIDEIIGLNQRASSPVAESSSATKHTAVFSSPKESTATKPTSAGTSYPVDDYFGKGKATATYASSVSATQGSGSDTELEATRDNSLFGVGDWTADDARMPQKLRSPAKTRSKRPPITKRSKPPKKPVVIIQRSFARHDVDLDRDVDAANAESSSEEERRPTAKQVARRDGRETKYLRQRRNAAEEVDDRLARLPEVEEGRVNGSTPATPPKVVKGARLYVLIGSIIAVVLTFSLGTFAAYYTGKGRMRCTKGIIFSASVLISCFTIIAMVVARRPPIEALVAGLLEFLIGYALVREIHGFM